MDNMEKLTHPVELSGEELDLVAAGWGNQQPCGCEGAHNTNSFNGNNNGNGNEGLIVVSGNLNGNTIVL